MYCPLTTRASAREPDTRARARERTKERQRRRRIQTDCKSICKDFYARFTTRERAFSARKTKRQSFRAVGLNATSDSSVEFLFCRSNLFCDDQRPFQRQDRAFAMRVRIPLRWNLKLLVSLLMIGCIALFPTKSDAGSCGGGMGGCEPACGSFSHSRTSNLDAQTTRHNGHASSTKCSQTHVYYYRTAQCALWRSCNHSCNGCWTTSWYWGIWRWWWWWHRQ